MNLFISSRWCPWTFLSVSECRLLPSYLELRGRVTRGVWRRRAIFWFFVGRSIVMEVYLRCGAAWHHWLLVFRGVHPILDWQAIALLHLLHGLDRLRSQIAIIVSHFWKVIIFFRKISRGEVLAGRRTHMGWSIWPIFIINIPNLWPSFRELLRTGKVLIVWLDPWFGWHDVLRSYRISNWHLVHMVISKMATANGSGRFIELLDILSRRIVSELWIWIFWLVEMCGDITLGSKDILWPQNRIIAGGVLL